MSTEARRAKWRELKRNQRAKDQTAFAAKRREYYAANREKILERQNRYYREVWKFKVAGVSTTNIQISAEPREKVSA